MKTNTIPDVTMLTHKQMRELYRSLTDAGISVMEAEVNWAQIQIERHGWIAIGRWRNAVREQILLVKGRTRG